MKYFLLFYFISFCFIVIKSHSVAQAGLKLVAIFPSQPSRCWNYKRELLCLAWLLFFSDRVSSCSTGWS